MRTSVVLGTVIGVAACGPAPQVSQVVPPPTTALVPSTPAVVRVDKANEPETFRSKAPGPGESLKVELPVPEVLALKNGTKVYLIERHDLPIVSVRLVSRKGASEQACGAPDARGIVKCEEKAIPGARSFAAAMLEQGTKNYNALQLSDAFESIGAQHGTWADWDSIGAFIKVTSDELNKGLDLLAEVTLRPTFPKAEFDRLRTRRLAGVKAEKDSLPAMGANAVAHSVFKGLYAHSLVGSPTEVEALKLAQVEHAYRNAVVDGSVAFLVAGDVTRDVIVPMLEKRFSALPKDPSDRLALLGAIDGKRPRTKNLVFVDKPGATQSYVLLALQGPSAYTRDRDALALMNVILGGSFSSRVNMNLREKHAYTYGARSRFSMRHSSGVFTVGGNMFADKTGAAVAELLSEFDRIQDVPVTDEELKDARESLLLALPGRMESVMELGSMAADLFIYGYKEDELRTLPERLAKVTIADIQRVAKAHLASDMHLVIVGDKQKVLPQLESLKVDGKALDVKELNAWGEPVKENVK